MTPVQHPARLADVRGQVDAHGGTVGLERVFVLAPPLHANLASGQLSRNQGRVQRGIVGPVVPITSGAVDVGDGDVFGRHVEYAGKDSAQGLYALAGAEHLQTAVVEPGDRGRWCERSMHDERSGVRRLHIRAGFRVRGRRIDAVSDKVFAQCPIDPDLLFLPPDSALSHPGREDGCRMFVGMRHGDETAVDDQFRGRGELRIETFQPVIQRGRPYYAGVKFGWKVLHEHVAAARLGIDIETLMVSPSNEAVVFGVLFSRDLADVKVELPVVRAPVVHGLVDARCRDLSIVYGHGGDRNTEFPPRCRQHEAACPRGSLAQCGAAGLERHRSRGKPFVRRPAGLRGDHAHALDIDVEFLRHDETQCRQDSLPQLDFAGHGDDPAGFDGDPAVEGRFGLERRGYRTGPDRRRPAQRFWFTVRDGSQRAQDPGVRAAPAELTVEGVFDLLAGRLRVAAKQRLCGNDDTGQAVAALGCVGRDQRLAHG